MHSINAFGVATVPGVLLASLELTLLLLLIWVGVFSIQVARTAPGMSASEAAPVPAT